MTSGIIEILIENADVIELVGSDGAQVKIYPSSSAPQNVNYPYVTVSETALNPSLAKGCAFDYAKPRYDVLVFSRKFRQTELIQQAIRLALDTGEGFDTDAGVHFDQIWMIDRQDLFLPAQGEESGLYVKRGVYEAMARERQK